MKRIIITIAAGVVMLTWALSATAASENTYHAPPVHGSLDCEGDACTNVTLTFDQEKQQYKVQNNSDRTVRVEASNWAGGSSVRIEAGKTDYLPMKSFTGPYRANYE